MFPESVPERLAWMKAASDELTAAGQAARQADGERHFGAARRPAGCRRTDSQPRRLHGERVQARTLSSPPKDGRPEPTKAHGNVAKRSGEQAAKGQTA